MSTTPNMNLVEPDVGITPGPEWAELLNAALELIDSHDHTPGKGTKVTQAGILINGDFSLNGFSATQAKSVELAAQGSTLTSIGSVYRVGNNLYYNNAAGAPVQITSGGSVNAPGSGAINVSVLTSYPYTVLSGDAQKALIVDTSAARTINLPSATVAMFFILKDGTGGAQTNPISVVPNGLDTIDGANATYLIDYNFASVAFVSDGVTKWYGV